MASRKMRRAASARMAWFLLVRALGALGVILVYAGLAGWAGR